MTMNVEITEEGIKNAEEWRKEIDELKSTIRRLRQEAITTAEEVKKWLDIESVKFHNPDKLGQQEGLFEVNFQNFLFPAHYLRAKDIIKYSTFQKKILALDGRILPDVEQGAWTLFLSQHLDSSLPVRG